MQTEYYPEELFFNLCFLIFSVNFDKVQSLDTVQVTKRFIYQKDHI